MKKQNYLLAFCFIVSCTIFCTVCTAQSLTDSIPPQPIVSDTDTLIFRGEPVRFINFYFDYDDDTILPDPKKSLVYLAEIMLQYPDIVIEIANHTDSRGKDFYNLELSKRRASSAVRYLHEKLDIPYDHLIAVGKGETEPLNRCTDEVKDCQEDEHRFNRRTEFKIIDGAEQLVIPKPPKR
jgi:outer membrane protein OmpA-like peptidoglycan-associated protein